MGEVIDIKNENENGEFRYSDDPRTVLFEVEKTWKGVQQTQVIVYTALSSASCGFGFDVGEKYIVIVYANEKEGELQTEICTRTSKISLAERDIDYLGEGEMPAVQVSLKYSNNGGYSVYLIGLLVGIVVFIGAIIIRRINK